jgi:hypothetical protein
MAPIVIGGLALAGYVGYKALGLDKELYSWTILLLAAASECEGQEARNMGDTDEDRSAELGMRN